MVTDVNQTLGLGVCVLGYDGMWALWADTRMVGEGRGGGPR